MLVFSLIAILAQPIASANGVLVGTKVYSAGPDVQCQAQQAIHSIDQSVIESLSKVRVRLPPPCGIGPWTRVAFLNMSNSSEQCPQSWRLYSANGVRACGRPVTRSTNGGCNSQTYTTCDQQSYQRVCGRIIGYQIGSTNVFRQRLSINQSYVDGVSVTYGDPRRHIWTFAGGISETIVENYQDRSCPCALNGTEIQPLQPPAFVGDHYFCESGNSLNTRENTNVFRYTDDPLWDGQRCEGQCCTSSNSPPWFNVTLPEATSEDIEVRICADQPTANEDVAVGLLEIYVQ